MNENNCSKQVTTVSGLLAHFGVWGSHPDHRPGEWQQAVANGDTRSGYWEWVAGQIEQGRLCPPTSGDGSDQISGAVQTALDAFWSEIAKAFPQITTGDLAPDIVHSLDGYATEAVHAWLDSNSQ